MLRLIIIPIIAGFIATAGITTVLWLIDKTGWTKADMVRALGSLFTKRLDNAFRVGLIFHFMAGIIISGVYIHVLSIIQPPGVAGVTFVGGVIGFVHGFIFSFVMVIVAEQHPVEEFKEADFEVAIAHIFGHVVYGLLIGLIFGILRSLGVDVSPGI
ncbi:MAG: hypothetical protein GWN16_04325 [Calditrichae bacterium]|nr:hypothetical protein [Calditrichia bacterium]NIV71867.1 hypothetical protein [Calditrichia bacterium]NIW78719.1 hypothetical protein [Calditrichia bacterium]